LSDDIESSVEEEEEVVEEMSPQLLKLQNLLEQKKTLNRYKNILELEKEVTLKRQFSLFMGVIGIDNQSVIEDYYPRFRDTLRVMDKEELTTKERLIEIVESDFLFDIMRLKTTSRERELRRVTKELSRFMHQAALDSDDEDSMFVQKLLSNALHMVASEIEPKENRQPNQPMLDAWVKALRRGMEEYLDDL